MKRTVIFLFVVSLFSCGRTGEIKTKVLNYLGTVSINGKALDATGSSVIYGDAIETGNDSFCELVINEKNILRLSSNTKLVFNVSDKDNVLELQQGWLAGVTHKVFAKEGKYLIKTPTVTASVRGTSYCIKVENPDSTYFCVCNGSIQLDKSTGKDGELVTSSHHAARRFKKDSHDAIIIDQNAGLLYHDDKGVEMLAKKVGEIIDWSKPDTK
jgi:hypothetical protein